MINVPGIGAIFVHCFAESRIWKAWVLGSCHKMVKTPDCQEICQGVFNDENEMPALSMRQFRRWHRLRTCLRGITKTPHEVTLELKTRLKITSLYVGTTGPCHQSTLQGHPMRGKRGGTSPLQHLKLQSGNQRRLHGTQRVLRAISSQLPGYCTLISIPYL